MPDNIVQHYGEFDDPGAISVIIEQLCRKRDISNGDKIVIDISEVEEVKSE